MKALTNARPALPATVAKGLGVSTDVVLLTAGPGLFTFENAGGTKPPLGTGTFVGVGDTWDWVSVRDGDTIGAIVSGADLAACKWMGGAWNRPDV